MTGGKLEGELIGDGRKVGRGAARSLKEGWRGAAIGDGRKIRRGADR